MRLNAFRACVAGLSNLRQPKMPLKFSANVSMMFKEQDDLLERYKAAKRAGFPAVECVFPYSVPAEQISAVIDEQGLVQSLVNSFMGDRQNGELGFAAVPGKEKEFTDALDLSIKYCKALKCKNLHVMAGNMPPHQPHEETDLRQKMEETFIKNLKEAVPKMEKEGIVALLEPMNSRISFPSYFLNTLDQADRIIKSVGHPNLKLQFDFFHVQIMHGNLTRNFEKYFDQVGYIQISQPPHRGQPDSPGEIDYNYVFSLLEKMGYDGWIGAEYTPTGQTLDSLAWYQKFKA